MEMPDDGEAFVIVGGTALHLARVETSDKGLHGRVVHAWALPRAGVTEVAVGTTDTSPEEIARRAGWPEVRVASRVQIPFDQISSARAVVDVVPDADAPSDSSIVPAFLVTASSSRPSRDVVSGGRARARDARDVIRGDGRRSCWIALLERACSRLVRAPEPPAMSSAATIVRPMEVSLPYGGARPGRCRLRALHDDRCRHQLPDLRTPDLRALCR